MITSTTDNENTANHIHSTEVTVTGKPQQQHHQETESGYQRTLNFLACVYCYVIVLLAGVLKTAESVTSHVSSKISHIEE